MSKLSKNTTDNNCVIEQKLWCTVTAILKEMEMACLLKSIKSVQIGITVLVGSPLLSKIYNLQVNFVDVEQTNTYSCES